MPHNAITQIRQHVSDLSAGTAAIRPGAVFALVYPGQVAVRVAGSDLITMPALNPMPAVGDNVEVLQVGSSWLCLGATARPATGTVADVPANGRVPVTGDDGLAYTPLYGPTYTPSVGDLVLLDWRVPGGVVLGPLSAAPSIRNPDVPVALNPIPEHAQVTRTFIPTDSATWSPAAGAYLYSTVWCADSLVGAYFYGTQIQDTIPDTATVIDVSLYLNEEANYSPDDLATFGTHALLTRTSGTPSAIDAVTVTKATGSKPLPVEFGTAFQNGTAYGLATNHGGSHIFSAKGISNSGALTITWTV